jgi:predicted ATPase
MVDERALHSVKLTAVITRLHVEGYRSIRNLHLDFGRANVVLGPNGSGKTNLYRALYLLAEAAHGRFARALADEGGMPSALWAGPRRKGNAAQVVVGATIDAFTYEIACGLPQVSSLMWEGHHKPSRFTLDPRIKRESASFHDGKRATALLERENASTWLRDADGARVTYPMALRDAESLLSQLQDPQRYPVVASLAAELRSWRFYHHFRTDQDSPLRHPQVGIQTPVLSADGIDLAAALQTIREIGDGEALNEEVDRAFPDAVLEIHVRDDEARFAVQMAMPGLARPLRAAELSDGTLRYLCLLAALLSPRPPTFLALNEPETSLHPDLLAPLAQLVARAAKTSQICLTTHAEPLARAVAELTGTPAIQLEKVAGETRVAREESE